MTRRNASFRKARRLLLIGPLALILLYASAAVSFATVAYRSAPARVLSIYPFHGPSLSYASANAIAEDETRGRQHARGLAQEAFRQSPVTPGAFRNLALLAQIDGEPDRSARLLSAAFQMNRRDLAVTTLLIEEYIRRGDLPGTLRLYDIALRTSRQAPTILLPNLIEAARDESFLKPLANTLALEPDWGDQFSKELVASDIAPENKIELARMLNGKRWFGGPFRHDLVTSLVRDGHFELAAGLSGKPAGYDRTLANAFDMPAGGDAFDWKLANSYYVETRIDVGDSGKTLTVRMSPEFRGPPARILLTLPPGSYRLSSALQSMTPAQSTARWTIECAAVGGAQLASMPLGRSTAETTISVGPACKAQWLALEISNKSSSEGDVIATVRSLSVVPIG